MTTSLTLTAPGKLELIEHTLRPLHPGEVLLRVEAAGICGSDIHGFAGVNDRRPVGVVMGHETVGRVVEVAERATFQVGDRVAVNPVVFCDDCSECRRGAENLCERRRIYGCVVGLDGGLATEMIIDSERCVRVAPDVDVRALAMIEPLSVGVHAVRIGEPAVGEEVLIVGGGPIGIAVALACLHQGAVPVVCEPTAERRTIADALGALVSTPDDLIASGSRYRLAFECVGLRATFSTAMSSVRTGGTVVVVGIAESELTVPTADLVIGERRLLGSSAYTGADFVTAVAAATDRAAALADLVGDATVDLADMPAVFQGYADGSRTEMKTVYVAADMRR